MKDVVDLLDGEVCKTHQVARRRHAAVVAAATETQTECKM